MLTASQKTDTGTKSPLEMLSQYLNQKRGVIRVTWDFSVQGGAIGTYKLFDENSVPALLPSGAIVTQVYSDTQTATTTSASGTLALTLNSSGDLFTATAAATWSGIQAGTPTGSAATMVKATAARQLTAAIATGALTAGKVNFFVEFVLSTTS